MELSALHRAAREIYDAALVRVDAARAVRDSVSLSDSQLRIGDTELDLSARPLEIYAVAAGKAAQAMASALEESLEGRIRGGVISAPQLERTLPAHWQVFAGGHPTPNAESLGAAHAAFALLRRANHPGSLIIFLISGGGSAMMEAPLNGRVSLDDLRETNRVLVSCGASIAEINAVRRRLSALKGGRLSALAPRAAQVSLIISDTAEGRARDVASGPTLPPGADEPDAASIVRRYGLAARLPQSILQTLNSEKAQVETSPQEMQPELLRAHFVLLDNADAMNAAASAARERGFIVELARDIVDEDVSAGAKGLVGRLAHLQRSAGGLPDSGGRSVCVISGGELACPVRGSGTGGRSAETALRCAFEMQAVRDESSGGGHMVTLCAGTDGIDGNSPAAGAIADDTTLRRARTLGLDPQKFLEDSDAYTFFNALGDAIVTGPTGTNVRDLRILLAG